MAEHARDVEDGGDVELHIEIVGAAEPGPEPAAIENWLRNDKLFREHHWEVVPARPKPGSAGGGSEFWVAVAAGLAVASVDGQLRALVGALAGWLRSWTRRSEERGTVLELRLRGRVAVRLTQEDLDDISAVVGRLRAAVEDSEAEGAEGTEETEGADEAGGPNGPDGAGRTGGV